MDYLILLRKTQGGTCHQDFSHTQWIGHTGVAVRPTQHLEKDMDTKGSNMH